MTGINDLNKKKPYILLLRIRKNNTYTYNTDGYGVHHGKNKKQETENCQQGNGERPKRCRKRRPGKRR